MKNRITKLEKSGNLKMLIYVQNCVPHSYFQYFLGLSEGKVKKKLRNDENGLDYYFELDSGYPLEISIVSGESKETIKLEYLRDGDGVLSDIYIRQGESEIGHIKVEDSRIIYERKEETLTWDIDENGNIRTSNSKNRGPVSIKSFIGHEVVLEDSFCVLDYNPNVGVEHYKGDYENESGISVQGEIITVTETIPGTYIIRVEGEDGRLIEESKLYEIK